MESNLSLEIVFDESFLEFSDLKNNSSRLSIGTPIHYDRTSDDIYIYIVYN